MISRDKIDYYHKKILADNLFVSSGRSVMLLNYLIQKAIDGEFLKEYTIGSDLFKRNYKADHNDGIVRVHVYNLRKKLKQYYQTTGAEDTVEFLLDKGDYNIQFIDRESDVREPIRRRYIASAGIAVAVVLAVILYSALRPHYYCWHNFIKGDQITNCILADQIVMIKNKNGVMSGVTNPNVISRNDFEKFSRENPSDRLKLPNYTTYTKAIPHSVQRLTYMFAKWGQTFNLVNESDFTIQDSRTANTLYIGQFKTMNLSRELFLKKSKRFGIEENSFYSIDTEGKRIVHRPKFAAGKREYEYAMVSYVPMDGGFEALYFTSNNDIGTMGVVSKFTDHKFLKEFYKLLPSEDSYFNALFKIEGINRTDLNCELIDLEVIE